MCVCGNGKLPKVMGKPAGVLLFGDFPGPCFMTCIKPGVLSSCSPIGVLHFPNVILHLVLILIDRCANRWRLLERQRGVSECVCVVHVRLQGFLLGMFHGWIVYNSRKAEIKNFPLILRVAYPDLCFCTER